MYNPIIQWLRLQGLIQRLQIVLIKMNGQIKKSKIKKSKKKKSYLYVNVILFTIELHTSHTKTNKLDKLSLKKKS